MVTDEQKRMIFKKIGYHPSEEQLKIHFAPNRIRLVAGGERSGKSYSSAAEYTSRFWETPLFWLVAADYERTRAEYNYICQNFDTLGIQYKATKSIDPGEILISGGFRINTKSAKDPRKLAMEAPDGILVCEASQVDYETYLRLRGRIAEKRGWLLLSGTFESSLGWYPELFTRWQSANEEDAISFSMPTWTNLAIFPGGRQDPEILALERELPKEWFMERYGGIPMPPKGLVFNEFRNNIHTGLGGDFEFVPLEPCEIWVDPGYQAFYSVLVVQRRGEHVYIIDEMYERGMITSDMIKACRDKPWWNMIKGGAIDIAGTYHQAMPAPAEIWAREAGIHLRSNKVRIQDGIERTKSFLIVNPITNAPQIHINTRCKGLISEMGGCPNPETGQTAVYAWKQNREGITMGDVPADMHNHSCKALAYGLVDMFGYSLSSRRAKVKFW